METEIKISAQDQASKVLEQVTKKMDQFGSSASETTSKVSSGMEKMNESIRRNSEGIQAIGAASGVLAVGLAALGSSAVSQASKMQDLRIDLDVLTGSAERGAKLFQEIQKEASKTPFESEDLVSATSTMLQFGIAQEDVLKNMRMLGDISGGNANRFKSLSLVFGQISSAGKLTGGDLLQLINVGFNPLKSMADRTGESMASLREKMSDGQISFEMVKKEMELATQEGGLFFGMMDKKSATFSGVMSTLKDNVGIALASLGGFANGEVVKGGLLDMLTDGMNALMPLLNTFVAWAQENSKLVTTILLVSGAIATLIASAAGIALLIPSISAGISLLVTGFKLLWGTITGPIGVVIGLATALYLAYTNNFLGIGDAIDGLIAEFMKFLPQIKAVFQGVVKGGQDFWNSMKQVFDSVVKGSQELWNKLKVSFDGLKKSISSTVDGIISSLKSFRETRGKGITAVVTGITASLLPALAKMLYETTISLGAMAAERVANTAKIVYQIGVQTITAIPGLIAQYAEMVAKAVVAGGAVVVQRALMAAGSVASAATMAASWLVAMGPIPIIIGIIVGLATLIYLHRDEIKAKTIEIRNAISERTKQARETMKTAISGAIDSIGLKMTEIWNKIMEVWNGITSFLMETRNSIVLFATETRNGISMFFQTTFEAISSIITLVWTNISTFLSEVRNGIVSFAKKTRDGLVLTITTLVNSIYTFMTSTGKTMITGAFTSAFDSVSSVVKTIANNVLGTLEGMINGAIDAINKLIESANSVAPIKIPTVPRLSIPKFAHGGMVGGATAGMQKFAFGGEVQGPGGIDKVPAMLSPGEVVLNRAQQGALATQLNGGQGKSITINVSGNFYGDDKSFANKIGDTIIKEFMNHYSFERF